MARSAVRAGLVVVVAALLAGCGLNWRASTYDPRTACESFAGDYDGDGGCSAEAP